MPLKMQLLKTLCPVTKLTQAYDKQECPPPNNQYLVTPNAARSSDNHEYVEFKLPKLVGITNTPIKR